MKLQQEVPESEHVMGGWSRPDGGVRGPAAYVGSGASGIGMAEGPAGQRHGSWQHEVNRRGG